MTDPIKDAAAQIRAMPDYDAGLLNDFGGGNVDWWQDYLRAEIGRANDHWREAAAALVEAMPQAVAGRWETTSEHIARDMAEGRFPGHSERKWLTPTAVVASPAPDPVSQTPTLDAMAMQRAAIAAIDADGEYVRAIGLSQRIATLPMPDHAVVLAEAMKLPEVVALAAALTLAANRLQRLTVEFAPGTHNFIVVGEWADEARAALKGGE